jgi:excisionase family DNA binding protein
MMLMTASEAASVLKISLRTLHELARTRRIPHRRLAGQRRLYFREDELELWLDGCELEVVELGRGRVVRPRSPSAPRRARNASADRTSASEANEGTDSAPRD